MEINLNIYYVEQANFIIIICNKKAIIYYCRTLKLGKWTNGKNLINKVKNYLKKFL